MSAQNIDVLIYVEHPVRELDVAVCLKILLEQRHGLTCAVRSMFFNELDTIRQYRPRVVSRPFFIKADRGTRGMQHFWPGVRFANLAYEQLLASYTQKLKRPRDVLAKTELHYACWGEFYRQFLLDCEVLPELLTITGSPVLGLYNEPYRSFFQVRDELAERHGLDKNKRWIFIPENYATAFLTGKRIRKYQSRGISDGEVTEMMEWGNDSLRTLCQWLKNTPNDVEIIFRPRPSTGMSKFMEKVEPFFDGVPPHVHITYDATVREWILASDAVASSYSTSLVEAAVAGKPVYMIKPRPFPASIHNEWYDLVDDVCTFDDWVAAARGTTTAGGQAPLQEWAQERMLPRGDAIVNMADWLASIVADQKAQAVPADDLGSRAQGMIHLLRPFLHEMRRNLLGASQRGRGHDLFSNEVVEEREARWRQALSQVREKAPV